MLINVNFTLDVDPKDFDALEELAGVDRGDYLGARVFIKQEAFEYTTGYLKDNKVPFTVIRDREHPHHRTWRAKKKEK